MRTEGWTLMVLGLAFAGIACLSLGLQARGVFVLASMLGAFSLLLGLMVLRFSAG